VGMVSKHGFRVKRPDIKNCAASSEHNGSLE
jgi:hypothetical protein